LKIIMEESNDAFETEIHIKYRSMTDELEKIIAAIRLCDQTE